MPPQETPSKEGPDPIHVLISIIKPGPGRCILISSIVLLTIVHFLCYSDSPSVPPLFSAICSLLSITCPIPFAIPINIIRIILSILAVVYIGINFHEAYKKKSDIVNSFHKNQPQFFTIIVVFGGTLAILIPMIMNVTKLIGDGAPLTTALLGITGGIIAIFGYYKTHQKSELEKEQMNMQKQKDARDHIRQLHDSYNDRFDKAVAELNGSDVKAAYTAVPKLAKLADAWLDYEDLSNDAEELKKLEKKAKKEVQTIINILCKYIRTIPNDYTRKQLEEFDSLPESDIEKLTHEADIRRLIFSEMSKRSSTFVKNQNIFTGLNSIVFKERGSWSGFAFDFSRAPIFYYLDNLTIESGKFTNARFYGTANFTNTIFVQDAYFTGTKFTKNALFSNASFISNSFFDFSEFTENAHFGAVNFKKLVNFSTATFNQKANFRDATLSDEAWFAMTTFLQGAIFLSVTFEKYEPVFAGALIHSRFSIHAEQQNYHFSVRSNSKPLHTNIAKLYGIERRIPVGATLFDPKSPKDKNGNYRESAPAGQLFTPMIPLKFSYRNS